MKTARILIFFLLTAFSATLSAQDNAAVVGTPSGYGTIKVRFSNLRNTNGQLGVALFATRDGFPGKQEKAVTRTFVQANVPQAEAVFEKIPYGTYAVSVYHDENSNGKLDTVFLIGMPKEGVGCSNNPKSHMGPPSFADSKFTLDNNEVELTIALKYL
jgi:uncharacterized protein (DUF2141 family)